MSTEDIPEYRCIKHPDRKAVVVIRNHDSDAIGTGFCNECNISLPLNKRSEIAFDAYLANRSTNQDIPALVAEQRRLLDDIARMRCEIAGADAVALDYKKTIDRQNEYIIGLRAALENALRFAAQRANHYWIHSAAASDFKELAKMISEALKGGE